MTGKSKNKLGEAARKQKQGKSRKKLRKNQLTYSDNSKVKRVLRSQKIKVAQSTSQLKRFKNRASMTLKKKKTKSRPKPAKKAKNGHLISQKNKRRKNQQKSTQFAAKQPIKTGNSSSYIFGTKQMSKSS